MTDNLPLRDLQKIILGSRTEPMSAIEIRNLFSHPASPELVLYIILALNQKKIDPQTTLIQSIANATRKEDLIAVGLALRYGASPNLYVNAPNIGDIHILGYAYLLLHKKDTVLLNAVVIMLMVMGADPNLPVFDSKGGIVRDEFSLVEPLRGQSVLQWLNHQGFETIIPKIRNKNYQKIDKEFLTLIGTYLDRNDLLKVDPKLDDVIAAHSMTIFNKNLSSIKNIETGLKSSIAYLNIATFEQFIDQGAVLDYADTNNIILLMKEYQDQGDIISREQLNQMLNYAVTRGLLLDIYQEQLLQFNPEIYNKIITAYNVPYWRKICSVTGRPDGREVATSDRLKLLAYRLNLNPEESKDVICDQIRTIIQSDPTKLKRNVIDRNTIRIRATVAQINEFENGAPPALVCSNQSVLTSDPYDHPDLDIAFYRDANDLWCFTSNNFTKIIEQKKNPYNLQNFPKYFLKEVQEKLDTISRYRSVNDLPTPISETIDSLTKPDIIANVYTDKSSKFFLEALTAHGLTEWNIDKLSPSDMETLLLDNFGVEVNLSELDKDHAKITFYVVSYQELLKRPSENFFKQIESLTNPSSSGNITVSRNPSNQTIPAKNPSLLTSRNLSSLAVQNGSLNPSDQSLVNLGKDLIPVTNRSSLDRSLLTADDDLASTKSLSSLDQSLVSSLDQLLISSLDQSLLTSGNGLSRNKTKSRTTVSKKNNQKRNTTVKSKNANGQNRQITENFGR